MDVATGHELRVLAGHAGSITAVAFHPGGTMLASYGDDHAVRLWDLAAGVELRCLDQHPYGVARIAFSLDGATLTAASGDTMLTWETSAGTLVRDHPGGWWDRHAGKDLRRLTGYNAPVSCIAFDRTGDLLATGGEDGLVRVWRSEPWIPTRLDSAGAGIVAAVAFSPRDRTLAYGGEDGTVRLCDPSQGSELHQLDGLEGAVQELAFSPDGQQLAAGNEHDSILLWEHSNHRWSMGRWRQRHQLRGTSPGANYAITGIAFTRNSQLLVSSSEDGNVQLWETQHGTVVRRVNIGGNAVSCLALSADGRYLAYAHGSSLRFHDLQNIADLDVPRTVNPAGEATHGRCHSLAFHPQHPYLAVGFADGTVLCLTLDGQEVRRIEGHTGPVSAVAFHPSANYLASSSSDGTTRLWHLPAGIP